MVKTKSPNAKDELEQLARRIKEGDRRAVGRAISLIEDEVPAAETLLDVLFPLMGKAYRIGITGPPGAGKSTLTAALTRSFRRQGKKVGIIAVDPTSPFTGGAVLGDRVRMAEFNTDPGVFIRSMASRGSMGGLARKAEEAAEILAAAGADIIIFETVGVGQTELEIADTADTTLVVLVPESGDSIQAMKAGLMEIADVFVVNKADREGADRVQLDLAMMLQLRDGTKQDWTPPIVQTVANQNKGIDALLEKIEAHHQFLEQRGKLEQRRRRRLQRKTREIVAQKLAEAFWTPEREAALAEALQRIDEEHVSPYGLAQRLLEKKKKA
ncbi:MAG: methylmalonyl Co-A mutase-associated GTPase MeaB [Calditrichaeota bacterium]|nr:MAG: methylmalonyl Co-A mutase-associated GTPase MeaB [Calditrichota bacterium]